MNPVLRYDELKKLTAKEPLIEAIFADRVRYFDQWVEAIRLRHRWFNDPNGFIVTPQAERSLTSSERIC